MGVIFLKEKLWHIKQLLGIASLNIVCSLVKSDLCLQWTVFFVV